MISDHHVDLIAIQETKKESFTNRALRFLSSKFDKWCWLPSVGRAGGILFGCDSDDYNVLDSQVHRFSISVWVQNRKDMHTWMVTIVYAPIARNLKKLFWDELQQIRLGRNEMWIVCGDVNAIRKRSEKSGQTFDVNLSSRFNDFVNDHHLIELKLPNRKFTWSNGRQQALLDRYLVSLDWIDEYSNYHLLALNAYGSDHTPLLLQLDTSHHKRKPMFKIDPEWLRVEEFQRLIHKWWSEDPLSPLLTGVSWHKKLKKLRKKIQGWAKNFYGDKKKRKKNHSGSIILFR